MTNRHSSFVTMCIVFLMLNGCAQYYVQTGQLDSQIETWQKAHKYQTAIDTIDKVPADNLDYTSYQKQREQLITEQQIYIQNTIKKANKLIDQRHWYQANELYLEAMAGNPDQPLLQKGFDKNQLQVRIYTTKLQHQLNLIDADVLHRRLPIVTELQRSNPDNKDYQQQLTDMANRRQKLYEFSITCAEDGLQYPNLTYGAKCLQLARKLSTDASTDKSLTSLEKNYAKRNQESSNRRQKKANDKVSALQPRYQKALEQQDYFLALEILEEQQQLLPNNSELTATHQALEADIAVYVQEQMQLGADAYSDSNINLALEIWRPLLQLSPENLMLLGHIQRAENFNKKLEKLQSNQ